MNTKGVLLVTGASGYIGGRLVPRLIENGYAVRCLTRAPENLKGRWWSDKIEVVQGDVYKNENLFAALEGVEAAYYLIHSMADVPDFESHEAVSAENFAAAAKRAGVKRIVYLGGLGRDKCGLSKHLKSRHRVGEILRLHGPPLTEFRAAIIIGSGSVSFEIIRYLTERLPVLISGRFLDTLCQPVAIRDVLSYLVNCLEKNFSPGRIIEIGGGSTHTYRELLAIVAQTRGLKRRFIELDVLQPAVCSFIVGLLTPVPAMFARPLFESLKCDVVCENDDARTLFPEIKPLDYRTALQYALMRVSENNVETTWAMSVIPALCEPYRFTDRQGLIAMEVSLKVNAGTGKVYRTFCGLGGQRGWLYCNLLWEARALADRLLGGVGMRRGRRHPEQLFQGEPLDFWRVERVIEGRLILLRAEMKLPGKGWLEFEALPDNAGGTVLRQTAYFEPKGLTGNIYWHFLYALHKLIFRGLAQKLKILSETAQTQPDTSRPREA